MISTGSGNGWLINWDNSSIGEGLETGISGSINSWSSIGIDSSINSLGGKVVSTGSGNSWLINWDNSSIWVSNKLGVKVEGTSITIGGNWGSNWGNWGSSIGNLGNWGSNWSSCVSNLGNWGSNLSNNWGSSGISLSLGNKVISTGSSNSWLINRDNSTIGVGNELGVKVQWSLVSISWGIAVARVGNWSGSNSWGSSDGRGSSIRNWSRSNSWGSRVSSNWRSSNSNWGSGSINCSLGSKMISTGSSNSWLINRDNSSIGESLEAIKTLCRGCGNTGGENLKFLLMRSFAIF